MALTIGARVGVYEVIAPIGQGGMGQVFRARDTRLNRDVAIKVLPDLFASDVERLARLTREAQTLAALNHPNIANIHGLEDSGGVRALVMELVEGEDLSQRIARGAIPAQEALSIAQQIAAGLAAAHEQGIIHRDLKPANIKIRSDGTVKVLDFGLAKSIEPASSAASARLADSPTITSPASLTAAGVVLGTAAYMSPEQAKGRLADRRSDVWAFGVVLYEMLTGQRPFTGDDAPETLASILTRQPDWTALPAASPPLIRRLLRRCLEKDRTRRMADIADVRLEIDDALSGAHAAAPVTAPASRTRERLAWASAIVLAALTAAAITLWTTRVVPVDPETTRALVSVAPTNQVLAASPLEQRLGAARPTRTAVALSPDGKTLVFAPFWGGEQQLYARAMDQLSASPIPGTRGAVNPFFSPDGSWVAFWVPGELRKVPLNGGPAVTICNAPAIFGASWGTDDAIVLATARNGGLWRVAAAGGTPESLTTLQPGEYSHRLPHVLPGGDAVIFTIAKAPARWDDAQVVVRSRATGQQTVLVEGGADGRYLPTGHLVYARMGSLMAAPFDPVRLALTGGAIGLIEGVMQASNNAFNFMRDTGAAQFTVSGTGALVYVTGGVTLDQQRVLAWVNRKGASELLPAPPRPYFAPRLSRDGQHVAVFIQQGIRQVWGYDIARGALSALTVDGRSSYGIFSPDRKRLVLRSSGTGAEDNLYWKAADGSGVLERLTTSARSQTPVSWSPDGTTIAFVEEADPVGQFDIWALSIADRRIRALVQTAANETSAEFSPDGRWLAYVSNQSGRSEVYVQPYPGPGERHLISTNGGATVVEEQWPRTVLSATRGAGRAVVETHVRPHRGGPGLPGGNP